MGTLSPEDEKTLLWTCGTIIVLGLLLVAIIGGGMFYIIQEVFF